MAVTNLERWFGTPKKAAKTILGLRHITNDRAFENAWCDWYHNRMMEVGAANLPSQAECMAEWLREEVVVGD